MIYIKSEKEIELMRVAGKVIANLFEVLEKAIKPGITTLELDRIAEEDFYWTGIHAIYHKQRNWINSLKEEGNPLLPF